MSIASRITDTAKKYLESDGQRVLAGIAVLVVALAVVWAVDNAALWHGLLFACTIVSAAVIYRVTRRDIQSTERLGWYLIALALLARAVHHAVGFYLGVQSHPSLAASLNSTAGYALALQSVLLWVALLSMSPVPSRAEGILRAFDSLLVGTSFAIMLWWLVEPAMPILTLTGWARPFAAMANSAALLMAISLALRTRQPATSLWLIAGGVAALVAADYLFFFARILTVLASVAALLLLALAALRYTSGARKVAPNSEVISESDSEKVRLNSTSFSTSVIETDAAESGSSGRRIADIVITLMPVFAALAGVHHLTQAPHWKGGVLAQLWWVPLLVGLVAIRQLALAQRANAAEKELRTRAAALEQTMIARTQLLARIHAASALNSTLDSEKLLVGALDQMREIIGVGGTNAGAIWLRADSNAFIDDVQGNAAGITNEAFLRRQSEREAGRRRHENNGARNIEHHSQSRPATARHSDLTTRQTRWRLVRAHGFDSDAERHTLNVLNEALERGGLTHSAHIAATQMVFAATHFAPIRHQDEIVGAFAVLRHPDGFSLDEITLLDALADTASAALHNAQLYQAARHRADLDGVTDLFNHRTVAEKLDEALAAAKDASQNLTLVMMDLNNFKFFNDSYGHPVGDQVLRIVARSLAEICRNEDVIGRYGGDEFIALLTDTNAQGALEVCSRIAARVEDEPYRDKDGRRIPIGLSFGAAVFPHDGQSALELLSVADANLYEAKRGGTPLMSARNPLEENQQLRQLKEVGVGGSFGVLDALVTAIDNKDHYTRRHSEDVTHWATLIAREIGASTEVQRAVRICGLLHDVGKIAVPDAILRKAGRLDDDEFQIMQQHPVFGALIVKDVPNLTEVLGGVRHHHERFDGKGYPDKLSGEAIPLLGRILAVPDCFSAMTTERPYRKALSWSEAISEIERGRGTQFDPNMANAFLNIIERLMADESAKSFDRDGTRHSVLQLPQSENMGEAGSPLAESTESVARPRSVADADALMAEDS